MARHNRPRKGSLAFRPRKRAANNMPRVNIWPSSDKTKLLGFAGYKAGMTHVLYIDQSKSHLKGRKCFVPVTIIEVPDMTVYGLRFIGNGQTVKDVLTDDPDILKKAGFVKRAKTPVKPELPSADSFDEVYVLIYALPEKTCTGKKKVDKMMIKVSGKCNDATTYAQSLLGKNVSVSDIFSEGQYIDVISVTKGKGWQGIVKRFGVATQRPKASKRVRHIGNMGPFKPAYVSYEIPQAGQMGYHKRTEFNKLIMKISNKPEDINPDSGFPGYGIIKNGYVLIRGSVAGPKKRLIRMRVSVRKTNKTEIVQLSYVSKEPQN